MPPDGETREILRKAAAGPLMTRMTDREEILMSNTMEHDFALEYRLRELDPELHRRFADGVVSMQHLLNGYQRLFPDFTDHTVLHSMTIIDFCNRLIGDQITRLNKDEIFCLLMGCYLHDVGMGVSDRDLAVFSRELGIESPEAHDAGDLIRQYHHEFSGQFIRKYAEFFEFPSAPHLRAVVQIARGHRKTDLMDESDFRLALRVPNGNTICLPYLAALVRLADEIDVTAARNPTILYRPEALTEERDILEHRKHLAVRDLEITADAFTLLIDDANPRITERIYQMAAKMQATLDECRAAVLGRTPFEITQREVRVEAIE